MVSKAKTLTLTFERFFNQTSKIRLKIIGSKSIPHLSNLSLDLRTKFLKISGTNAPSFHKPILMMHSQKGFDLAHRVKIHANHNYQRSSAHQHCHRLRKTEDFLDECRQYSDYRQEQRAWQYKPIQYLLQILLGFVRPYAGNGAAVLSLIQI